MKNLHPYEIFMKNIEEYLDDIAEMEAEERGIPDVAYSVGAKSRTGNIVYAAYSDFQEMHEENPDDIEARCYKEVLEQFDKEIDRLNIEFGSVDNVKDPYDRAFLNALEELKYCMEID